MNLEWFSSFVETVKYKSISQASEHLNLTQPAISKQIRKLEDSLGVILFTRSTQGIELTEAGELLYQRIQPVLAQLQAIRADLSQIRQPTRLAIGAFPTFASNYLPQKVIQLRQQGYDPIITVLDTSEELLAGVLSGQIDLAFVATEADEMPHSLWFRALFTEPYLAVIPIDHPLNCRDSVLIKDICTEPLIVHPVTCKIRQTILQMYQQKGVHPHIRLEVSYGQSILGYVAAHAGITIVPKIIAEHASEHVFKSLPITDFTAKRTISIVTRSEKVGKTLYPHFV